MSTSSRRARWKAVARRERCWSSSPSSCASLALALALASAACFSCFRCCFTWLGVRVRVGLRGQGLGLGLGLGLGVRVRVRVPLLLDLGGLGLVRALELAELLLNLGHLLAQLGRRRLRLGLLRRLGLEQLRGQGQGWGWVFGSPGLELLDGALEVLLLLELELRADLVHLRLELERLQLLLLLLLQAVLLVLAHRAELEALGEGGEDAVLLLVAPLDERLHAGLLLAARRLQALHLVRRLRVRLARRLLVGRQLGHLALCDVQVRLRRLELLLLALEPVRRGLLPLRRAVQAADGHELLRHARLAHLERVVLLLVPPRRARALAARRAARHQPRLVDDRAVDGHHLVPLAAGAVVGELARLRPR
eukprot:scaffold30342_cov53-Phaeocystis_antarctica.AAC.2